jgi:hypothetical protein
MRPPDASSQLSDFLCFSRHQPSRIPRAPPCRDSTTTHEQGQPVSTHARQRQALPVDVLQPPPAVTHTTNTSLQGQHGRRQPDNDSRDKSISRGSHWHGARQADKGKH